MVREEAVAKVASLAPWAKAEQPEPRLSTELSEIIAEMEMQLDCYFQDFEERRFRLLDVEIVNRSCGSRNRRRLSRKRIKHIASIRRVRQNRRVEAVLS